jgi:hypothetical protein
VTLARRPAYSPIRHLAWSIWLNHDPARCHLAIFTAYFDASGHPDATGRAPALFVSGFVASEQKWLRFETEWLALLDKYGITPPFHMTDFEAGKGQYAALKNKPAECEAFRAAAIRVMTRSTNKALSVGVVVPDFRRWLEEYEVAPDVPRHPYPWCAMEACRLVVRWAGNRVKAGKSRLSDQVKFVFQYGDKHQGAFAAAAKRKYGQVPIFLDSEGVTPFQACDFLAWEHRRWLSNRSPQAPARPRDSVMELARRIASDSAIYADWRTLSASAEQFGWPKRGQS